MAVSDAPQPGAADVVMGRIVRFSVSGVLVTLVHIAVAAAWLHWINGSSALANGCAFSVATAFSYCIHTLWSFSARMEQRVFVRFLVVAMFGLFLSAAVAHIIEWTGLPAFYSVAAVVLVMPVYNFLAHHFWTYAEASAASNPTATERNF